MMGKPDPRTIERIALLVIVVLALPLASSPVVADEDPETAEEYFNTLRSMEDLEIYDDYGELETIHSRSLTEVQVGSFTDAERQELDAVIGMLRSFSRANERVGAEEYEQSFDEAENVEANISRLGEYDETYSVLATLALTRYYETLGNELSTEADAADRTAAEIELRSMAATAFKRANEPGRASEFIRQSERLKAQYDADREFIDETTAQGQGFLEDCDSCSSPTGAITGEGVGVFAKYGTAEALYQDTLDAEERAASHGLDDQAATLADLSVETQTAWQNLGIAAAVLMIGYGLVVGVIAAVVIWRIFDWKRTYLAARLDSVVAMGDSDV